MMLCGNRNKAFEGSSICGDATYASIVAPGDHVPQLVLTSRPGAQIVADWLVSLPPWPPRAVDNNVLIGRGDLCVKNARIQS